MTDGLSKDVFFEVTIMLKNSTKNFGLGKGVLKKVTFRFLKGCNPAVVALDVERDQAEKLLEFKWKEVT